MAKARRKIAVYRIQNTLSGSYYVGSSTNLYERWRTHRNKLRGGRHPNPKLQSSWAKHGEAVFEFIILAEFDSVVSMEEFEEQLLRACMPDPLCCNLSVHAKTPWRNSGALHPSFGKPRSEAQKEKLREAALEQWRTADPRTGRTHSAESKAKISAKVRQSVAEGRGGCFIPTEETRAKMSAALKGNQCAKGHVRTEEHRRKLSEANTGNQNWLGKSHSVESRLKMGRAVVAVSPEGVETEYGTITILRGTLDLLAPTINRALKTSKPLAKGPYRGWSFRYA